MKSVTRHVPYFGLSYSGLLCSLLSILHPGISLTCAYCLSALLQACLSNTTAATTSPCSTPRSVLRQGGLTREPFGKEGTQGDAETTQEWWGEGQMGGGLAFQGLSPPVEWRERREVEGEEKEEEVPPPIISLPDLVAAMDLAWHGAATTVAMSIGRTTPKWRWDLDWCRC